MKNSRYRFLLIVVFSIFLVSCSSTIQNEKLEINNFIDNWHFAAAEANYDAFFNSLDDSAIYLGTQADERWTKPEFIEFAKPYFDKGKAWDFEPFDREVYLSSNKDLAWFEESLITWMGVCRGSGVVSKKDDSWRILHYNLSVTISNDLVGEFIEIVKKDSINSFLIEK